MSPLPRHAREGALLNMRENALIYPPDRWITCTERALVVFLPQWPSCPAQHASCISQACWCARRLAGVGCVSCPSMSIRRWSLVVR